MKLSPNGLFGSMANVPPMKPEMWNNPTYGMWNRQPAAPMPGGYGGAASTLGRGSPQMGALGLLAQQLGRTASLPPGGAPTTPTPGTDAMISPDFLNQLLRGGGLFGMSAL